MLRRLPLFILTALLIVAALLSLIALPRQSTTADDSAGKVRPPMTRRRL